MGWGWNMCREHFHQSSKMNSRMTFCHQKHLEPHAVQPLTVHHLFYNSWGLPNTNRGLLQRNLLHGFPCNADKQHCFHKCKTPATTWISFKHPLCGIKVHLWSIILFLTVARCVTAIYKQDYDNQPSN